MLDVVTRLANRAPTAPAALSGVLPQFAANCYVDGLRLELGITAAQSGAWERFADSLRANRKRMGTRQHADVGTRDPADTAFGPCQERLAALGAMRIATSQLLAVLTTSQRQKAEQLLPLCCLLYRLDEARIPGAA
jgi:hypothetical protein